MALQTKTVATGDYGWKSWSNAYVISLTLTEESTDTATNTSLVSYLFTISNTDNNRFVDYNYSWSISIGGQEIPINNFNFNLGANYTTQTIASGQVTVTHNSDGTLNMPYHVSIPNVQAQLSYGPPAMSIAGEWTLTAIPRASAISCPTGIIGKPVTVSVHKADDRYCHTITYAFGTIGGLIAEKTALSQIAWTIPTELYTQIPDAKRGTGNLTCKTYNGSTLVGESICQLSAEIDDVACRPTISALVEDVNEKTVLLTGDSNILVRYHSKVRAEATYCAQNSATVKAYTMAHNGKTYTADSVVVPNAENGRFDFSVTDSRGLTTNLSVTKTVIPYVKLTCNLAGKKPDGEGNMTISASGNYYSGSFGATENTLTLQYRYKPSGTSWQNTEEEWQTIPFEVVGSSYTGQTVLSGLDYQKAYTFQTRAIDCLATVKSAEYTARAIPIFDWGEQDFAIHGDLSVDGKVTVQDTAVLNTPHVQTYYWKINGGVSLQSVGEFMATRKQDCAFITMIQGTTYPFVGVAVGSVCNHGQYGAGVLYDYAGGARTFRLIGGELINES